MHIFSPPLSRPQFKRLRRAAGKSPFRKPTPPSGFAVPWFHLFQLGKPSNGFFSFSGQRVTLYDSDSDDDVVVAAKVTKAPQVDQEKAHNAFIKATSLVARTHRMLVGTATLMLPIIGSRRFGDSKISDRKTFACSP